jgi:hypothetical protein
MHETFGKSNRAIEHLEVFKEIYEFLRRENKLSDSEDCINSIFLNCFWFAYANVPHEMKRSVLELGTKYATETNLTGNEVIEKLKLKKYNLVVSKKKPSVKQKAAKFLFNFLKKISGRNLEALESVFRDGDPVPYDVHRAMASTRWVHDHENFYGIRRWKTIYDCTSEASELNWGLRDGISKEMFAEEECISKKMREGMEYRVLVSLGDVGSAVINGVVLSDERSIGSAIMFDGQTTVLVSINILPKRGIIEVFGRDLNGVDRSKNCKILKIENCPK